MKYYLLKSLVKLLNTNAHKIRLAKRIDNNTIIIEFNDRNIIYLDMTRGNSIVYKSKDILKAKKDFNAPFDVVLQKRFNNSKVESVEIYNDDKIINIKVNSSSSYKSLITILQLEFTGKYTNIIILDENRVVLEALRHIDEFSSSRIVKVGSKLDEIPKKDIVFKEEQVDDMEQYLYDVYENLQKKNLENLKKQKIQQIQKKIKKIEKTINSLPKKDDLESLSNELYEKANLILMNIHNIKPYQKSFKTHDYGGNEIEIDLENCSSVTQYSNDLFKKAKKAKIKASSVSIEKDNLEEKLSFLNRLVSNLQDCQSASECEFLYPKKERNQAKVKKAQPYESFFFEGYKIMLGTSERENIYLLQNSKASDFWFHLKDRPSSHVIVQNTKKTLPESVIQQAAMICAKFSSDFGGTFEVDYTQRRNVKIQNGANVLYNPYTTTVVRV